MSDGVYDMPEEPPARRMRRTGGRPRALLPTIATVIVLLILFSVFTNVWTLRLWYRSVDLGSVFSTVLVTRVLLFVEQHPQCSKRTLRDGVGGRDADVDAAIRRLLDRGAVQNTGTANAHAYVPTRAPTTEREPGEEGTNELPF